MYRCVISATDLTITGHSHDTQSCHSLSLVKLSSAIDADAAAFPGVGSAHTTGPVNLVAALDNTRCRWDPCKDAGTCADPDVVPENPTAGLHVGYGRSPHAEGGCGACAEDPSLQPLNGVRRCGATSQSTMGWGSPDDPGNARASTEALCRVWLIT